MEEGPFEKMVVKVLPILDETPEPATGLRLE